MTKNARNTLIWKGVDELESDPQYTCYEQYTVKRECFEYSFYVKMLLFYLTFSPFATIYKYIK